MDLIDDLKRIVSHTEPVLSVSLTDEDYADGHDEVTHVFLHETCHAAVACCVPWIHDLREEEHTALDETLARLLETEVGTSLGLPVHAAEAHVRELQMYGIRLPVDRYRRLQEQWRKLYWPSRDLAGMATFALDELRMGDTAGVDREP